MSILPQVKIRRRRKSGTKNSILFVLLFFFNIPILGQDNPVDSLKSNPNIVNTETSVERDLNIPIESFKLFVDPYYFRNDDLQFSTNFDFSKTLYGGSFNQDKLYLINLNNKEFLKQISYNFQQSKPTALQQFLGMVNVAGAAALAGYHVYKYYVKEKKKF